LGATWFSYVLSFAATPTRRLSLLATTSSAAGPSSSLWGAGSWFRRQQGWYRQAGASRGGGGAGAGSRLAGASEGATDAHKPAIRNVYGLPFSYVLLPKTQNPLWFINRDKYIIIITLWVHLPVRLTILRGRKENIAINTNQISF
jgi:hypothetical protein